MRIPSGNTTTYLYFVAVDATDYVTRETGLTGFAVARSRNGAADVAYTTPTVTEIDATAMPGVYALLIDEDTTISSGVDSEEVCVHITVSGMAPVTRTFELYRPKATIGETLNVSSGALNAISDGLLTSAKFAAGAFDAVWSVTARLLTAGTNIVLAKGTGVTGFNDLSAAQVNAEADQSLADYDGPTNAEMVAAFTEIKGATWATTDTLEAIRDRGDAAWITATGFSTHSAADVRSEIDSNSTQLAAIVADTNELQTDWADGGRLDLILDARASQTSVDDLPTNAELATALGTADDAVLAAIVTVDTVVDAIKAKTDSLTFTVAGKVDSNVEYVNGTEVQGSGTSLDPWGP